MKIIFWGTPRTSVPFLEHLLKNRQVAAVVTQTDKPASRGQEIHKSPVKELAEKNGIPILQPSKLKDPEFLSALAGYKADAGVVVAYGRLIPNEAIKIFPKGLFNIHFSLLPSLRGAAPMQWAIYNGDKKTGVTSFFIVEALDAGNILVQKEIPMSPMETAASLEEKLVPLGLDVMIETLKKIENGKIEGVPQTSNFTLAPLIKKENCAIDWNQAAEQIDRQVRAFTRYGVHCRLTNGKTLKITQAEPLLSDGNDAPGTVISIEHGRGFVVKCKTGSLLVLRCQPEGKKEMDSWSFLQGHKLQLGAAL